MIETFVKNDPLIVWNTLYLNPTPHKKNSFMNICVFDWWLSVFYMYTNWYRLPVEFPLLLEQVVTFWTLWDREPSSVHIHHSAAVVCGATHPLPYIIYLTLVFSSLASTPDWTIMCSMVYFIISLAIPGLLTL